MRVADGPSVVGDDVGNIVFSNALALDFAQFQLSFCLIDANGLEATLHVIEDAEVLAGLLNRYDIHEP